MSSAVPQCAGDMFMAGLLDPKWVTLLDTAKGQCCAFDIRAVFRTKGEPIVVLVQAKRYEQSREASTGWVYVENVAFTETQVKARETARKKFNSLGANVVFLMVHAGDAGTLESHLRSIQGQGQNLAFLVGDGLKKWLPLMSSRVTSRP